MQPLRVEKFALMTLIFAAAAAVAAPVGASMSDLVRFLERADRMFTVERVVQAKVAMTRSDGTKAAGVLVLDPSDGGGQYFSMEETGWRSRTPLSWDGEGRAVEKTDAAPRKVSVDDPLGGTDLRGIDFFPFWKTDYTTAFISDESRLEKTVSLYAADERPYTLYVISFDKEKMVPRLIKYYRDSFSNMVRIRTDKDHVMVGGRPRPQKIMVRDFSENTLTTYDLEWSELEETPEELVSWATN